MERIFKNQLNKAKPLTEDLLEKLQQKTYFNGDKIEIGDIILFAMLVEKNTIEELSIPELQLKLVMINKRQFDLFEHDERFTDSLIPTLKLK